MELNRFVDKHIGIIKSIPYILLSAGVFYIVKDYNLVARFYRVSDIPLRYLNNRKILQGNICRIKNETSILLVKHKPLINILKDCEPTSHLKVAVAFINHSDTSHNWLIENIKLGKKIKFIPHFVENDVLYAEIKYRKNVFYIDVAESLVKNGLVSVNSNQFVCKSSNSYLKKLINLQNSAIRKNKGIWEKERILSSTLKWLKSKLF